MSGLDQLNKLLILALRWDNEGERSAALNGIRRVIERSGIDPHKLRIAKGGAQRIHEDVELATLRMQVEKLRTANAALRAELHEAQRERDRLQETIDAMHDPWRSRPRKKRAHPHDWDEFKELLARFLYNYSDPSYMPRGWRGQAAHHLGVDVETLKRWRDGREPIPQEVMESLRKVGR